MYELEMMELILSFLGPFRISYAFFALRACVIYCCIQIPFVIVDVVCAYGNGNRIVFFTTYLHRRLSSDYTKGTIEQQRSMLWASSRHIRLNRIWNVARSFPFARHALRQHIARVLKKASSRLRPIPPAPQRLHTNKMPD